MQNTKEEQYIYSVPSSILLCGEYIITEENGAGICLGIEPRSYLHIKKRAVSQCESSLIITCKYASQSITFSQATDFNFWAIALELAPSIYQQYHVSSTKPQAESNSFLKQNKQYYRIEICIDTTQLYDKENKKKLGLGSSASCSVLTCAAHMLLSHYNPMQHIDMLHYFATQLHYQWQQKKGSGYELYASIYGGALLLQQQKNTKLTQSATYKQGRFTYTAIPFPTQFLWIYWNSEHNISSRKALQKYMQWKQQNPEQQQELTQKILKAIDTYTQCKTYNDYCTWLTTMKKLGLTLGEAIGQSAHIELPTATASTISDTIQAYKACGAGNEQGIGMLADTNRNTHNELTKHAHVLSISEGFRQENSK